VVKKRLEDETMSIPPAGLTYEVFLRGEVGAWRGGCRNLMAPQDLKELGFHDRGGPRPMLPKQSNEVDWEARKQRGFVAGIKK
jgi:hypothetical protein